jgi:hypothetical protein
MKIENPVKQATGAVTKGVRNATKPELISTVAGFAGSRVLEKLAYENFRNVFGDNSVEGGLTSPQRTARTVLKATAAVLVAGTMIPSRNGNIRGAGVGLASGLLWHVLNDFNINV